jgi:serine/threonine protein kinase
MANRQMVARFEPKRQALAMMDHPNIGKATPQELTDKTVFTQFQQFIGTPAYFSPQQAEMSGLDIDTRADIYSSGALLYELLVGEIPLQPGERSFSPGSVFNAAYTPDDRTIAFGRYDKTIRLHHAATALELITVRGHKRAVGQLAFPPDGRSLVSPSEDMTVRL